jgi:hypothetical protein
VAVVAGRAADGRLGLVEEREVGGRPRLVGQAPGGTTVDRSLLDVGHRAGGRGREGRPVGEQAAHDRRRAELRPEAVEGP